eukprot:TRINITY_DN36763_c0_g1_i1.p1 TRINITY_DN36763_c0_g1~~TRINITY_DN36763_c0_g1_i1.p1  ORF type:complete len:341 (-),score=55.30 TRINITY_DN36763_c0_g1_i1:247-1269(-)
MRWSMRSHGARSATVIFHCTLSWLSKLSSSSSSKPKHLANQTYAPLAQVAKKGPNLIQSVCFMHLRSMSNSERRNKQIMVSQGLEDAQELNGSSVPTKGHVLLGTPDNWKEVLDEISRMLMEYAVPDEPPESKFYRNLFPPEEWRFGVLVSALLSSQTREQVTKGAVQRLRSKGLLSIDGILNAPEENLIHLIYPVAFYKRKAVHLKKVATICQEKFNGDIPRNLKDLLSLPGVGPKVAHLVIHIAWQDVQGICVDTHVHRICNRLGWVSLSKDQKTKTPEETRAALESWLPKEEWVAINRLLVRFGRVICTPLRPQCDKCFVNKLCPSAFKDSPTTKER